MKNDSRYSLMQFVQPRIQVGPAFFGTPLAQNQGRGTFGPSYFGIERYLGGLGQSSTDDGYYEEEEEYEEDLFGFGQLEDEKTQAARVATTKIESVRARLREAGRADLVEDVNATATLFQTRLAAAASSAEIVSLGAWLSGKLLGLVAQADSGASSPSAPAPSASSGGATPSPYSEPTGAGTSNTALLVLGGIALAGIGVYLLRMQG